MEIEERLPAQVGKNDGVGTDFGGQGLQASGHQPREQVATAPEVADAAGCGDKVLNRPKLEFEKGGLENLILPDASIQRGYNLHMGPDRVVRDTSVRWEQRHPVVVLHRMLRPKPPMGKEPGAPLLAMIRHPRERLRGQCRLDGGFDGKNLLC